MKFRLGAIASLVALAAFPVNAAMSKHIASYDIKARLDPDKKTIDGSETIAWFNDSPDTVTTLRFHLYMNAFKNENSTFMKESGGQLRGDKADKTDWGWVDVKSMRMPGVDLTKNIRFIHPDDDNVDDQSVIEVTLPQPVKPGETVHINVDFVTKLPKVFARTGYRGDFYLAGQWFPKLGVWEKAGFRYSTQGAWNCHQFHANSEFFANFGAYRVDLTIPSRFVVGSTGEMTHKVQNGDLVTYTFNQEDVTDFAWTAQPTYIREERMFEAAKETTPDEIAAVARLHGISPDEARLTDVKMIALLQPEHREQMDRHFLALRNAIKYFGLYYGHYPYKTITVVDPPNGGGGAGGMEYPTFITAGTLWRAAPGTEVPEMVVVHEFGHQFWMELVANNEFEESWLDEGFNTYSTAKVLETAYGPTGIPAGNLGINLSRWLQFPWMHQDSIDRSTYLQDPVIDDLVRNSWSYYNGGSYSLNSYSRTGITLRTLENILGADTMARVMRVYHQTWRFNHPTSRDFQKAVNQVSGRDMDWFFNQFVFGNKLLDYRVGSVTSNRVFAKRGVFDTPSGRVTINQKQADETDKKSGKDNNPQKMYLGTVKIVREGDAVVPVDIVIKFKNGALEKRQWDGQYRWVKYTFLKDTEIASVEVDPERKYLLDVSFGNNSYIEEFQAPVVMKWSSTLMFWFQNALLWAGSIA
jgi:hypothetical protein